MELTGILIGHGPSKIYGAQKIVPNNTRPSSFLIIKLNIYKLHTWYMFELISFFIFMYFLDNLLVD